MAPMLHPYQFDVFPPYSVASMECAVSELSEFFGSSLPSAAREANEDDKDNDDGLPPHRVLKRTHSGELKAIRKLSFNVKTPAQTPSPGVSACELSDAEDAFHESPLARKGDPTLTELEQLRNRNTRTANEIDVLEGLPIRQWRQVESHIGPPQGQLPLAGKSIWPELPMPRDSHMLPEVSQQLLRAARAGRLYKAPTPPHEDGEKENAGEDDEAKQASRGFTARKWTQVPRHLEEPEMEYLAKRRKGLPSTRSSLQGASTQASAVRKTMVKRYDTEGNAHIYEVLAPEGQKVEGEITNDDEVVKEVAPEPAAAPGTVVEEVRRFKPDPAVYQYLCKKAGKEGREEDVWLVSGNPFDVVGARAMGWKAVWVDRAGNGWIDSCVEGETGRPSVIVRSLKDVLTAVSEHRGT